MDKSSKKVSGSGRLLARPARLIYRLAAQVAAPVSIIQGVMNMSENRTEFFIAQARRTRVWRRVVMKKSRVFFSKLGVSDLEFQFRSTNARAQCAARMERSRPRQRVTLRPEKSVGSGLQERSSKTF
jgi:hypothetical protein